jgi:hypothetical protein
VLYLEAQIDWTFLRKKTVDSLHGIRANGIKQRLSEQLESLQVSQIS